MAAMDSLSQSSRRRDAPAVLVANRADHLPGKVRPQTSTSRARQHDTVFRIASMTKQFTGVAILLLAKKK